MKLIIAVIRPEKMAAAQAAMNELNVNLMTVSEVLDCNQEQCSTEVYRGRKVRRLESKLRLEIAVDDSCLETAVEAIGLAVDSDKVGGGKVFTMGLDEPVRPRSFKGGVVAIGH